MSRVANLLALIFLLIHFVQPVDAKGLGTLASTGITAEGGTVAGEFRALVLDASDFIDLSSLHVHGDFSGTVDARNTPYVIGGGSVAGGTTTQTPVNAQDADMTLESSKQGARILVRAQGNSSGIAVSSSIASLFPQVADQQITPSITTRPLISLNTKNTLEGTGIAGRIEVAGSFELIVYGANFTIHGDGSSETYITGFESRPYAPVTIPGQRGFENVTQREAYLQASNAVLTLNLTPPWALNVFNAMVSTGNGALTLEGATGGLRLGDGERILVGDSVRIIGDAKYEPSVQSNQFTGPLSGRIDALMIDGTTVPMESNGLGSWVWLWFAFAILVVAAAYASYRATCHYGLISLERLLAEGRYPRAIRRATKLMWFPRASEDAVVVQAVAWLKLNRVDEAKAILATKPLGRDRVRPGRLYLMARIAGLEGDIKGAKQQLLNCLLLAPNYLVEALADPVLAPLVKDVQGDMTGAYT